MLRCGGLQQKSARAGTNRVEDVLVIFEGCQDDDARRQRRPGEKLPRRLQSVDLGHPDIHEHDVGCQTTGDVDRFLARTGLTHHVNVGLGPKDHLEARPHERLIVRQQDPDAHPGGESSGSETWTAYPPSGRRPAENWPP